MNSEQMVEKMFEQSITRKLMKEAVVGSNPTHYRPKPTVLSVAVALPRLIHEENAKRTQQRTVLQAILLKGLPNS